MTFKTVTAVALMAMLAPLVVKAGCSGYSCDDVNLARFYLHPMHGGTGGLLIDTSADESALSCSPHTGGFLFLRADNALFSEIYALLLAAKTTDAPVGRLRMNDSVTDCDIVYAWLD